MMMVTGIPNRSLPPLWPIVWPLLERAARRSDIPESAVRSTIERGDAQLWAIFEGDALVAAVTTQITTIGEKGCRLWLVGGARMDEWAADFLAKAGQWARSLGCMHVWGTQSRPGWQRIVRTFGGQPITVDGKAAWTRRI